MMNPEVKAKWTEALRSGDYEQGMGALKHKGYCCLGVLGDLYKQSHPNVEWTPDEDRGHVLTIDGQPSSNCFLPVVVCVWAELDQHADVGGRSLASRNDSGSSFEQIADLIDEHL